MPGPRASAAHRNPPFRGAHAPGYSLVEVLMALTLGALVLIGLNSVAGVAFTTYETVSEKEDLTGQARFAMDQMVRTVSRSRLLILPQHDKLATNWPVSRLLLRTWK